MDSIVCYTEEIDDLDEAVKELLEQAEGFEFKSNTLGILFSEEDLEYEELYEILSETWDFPIIGCTGMSLLLDEQGFNQSGIEIMILSADDVKFSAGMTEELNYDNYRQEIQSCYDKLKAEHDSEIKLVLTYGGMTVEKDNVAGDDLVYAVSDACGGVPVYGGTAADSFSFNGFKVYCNGKSSAHGQALALISGNIDPKFVVINSIQNRASFAYEVTEAENNIVKKLGNGTFLDAMKREKIDTDKTDVLGVYILSPFLVEIEKEDGDRVEVARNLNILNQSEGYGSFLGCIPEGAVLNIGVIDRDDVKNSVEKAFDVILDEINNEGKYHSLLCTSCGARFMALGNQFTAECETYKGRIPEGVSLMGLYTYGEYCPVEGNKTGKNYNMFHNFTFTILAM